jgi:hypothetical protein
MTSDTDEKGGGSVKPLTGSKRPAPTIDLKATEVASEPIAGQPRKSDEPEAAPKADAPKTEMPQSKTETAAGDAPPHDAERSRGSRRPIWDQLPGGLSLPLIGTAVAAGIAFFLLGLATANLFVGREVAADARLERTQAVDDLAERLAKIETAVSAPRSPDAALIGRIATAEAAAKLATEQAAIQQRRAEELATLVREARSRADAAVASAEAAQREPGVPVTEGVRIDVDALNQRIATLEQALKSNEAELAKRSAADERKSRVAVVAAVLLGAVERGVPFTTELAAAKALAPDSNSLAPLDAFAASGVPGAAALSRELSALIPAMLKLTDSDTRRDGSFLDKLQANAERLVRIRPVGEAAGDRPVDVIARIEARAGLSDTAGAVQELSKLPPQVRAPAEDWIRKANARNAALTAVRQFSTSALAAIGKPNT